MGLYKVINNFLIKVNKSVKINNYINYFVVITPQIIILKSINPI